MAQPTAHTSTLPGSHPGAGDEVNVANVQALLRAKDDTKRFVGLALLKSMLDNSQHLREDEKVVRDLWTSISPKFIDRLLRTGSNATSENSKEMLDLVVSVLHIFALLLPSSAKGDARFADRIPGLVEAILQSSGDTTTLLLQLLHSLVSVQGGSTAFVEVDDLTPLTEVAPSHPIALDIIRFAWLNSMTFVDDRARLSRQIDKTLQNLASSFTGTDGVTFLEFLGDFLGQAYPAVVPLGPKWLKTAVGYIRNLVSSRPTPEARSAYTLAAASLLQTYPAQTCPLLFTDDLKDDKAFAYLFVNLLLIDIRSSTPTLLEQLNTAQYPATSRRLTSSFDILSIFIGYLVQSLEDESLDTLIMSPDNLLKLRKGISDTMSVTVEYLRDRWDASVAGAMGLHPDARVGAAETAAGSHRTLAWDSIKDKVHDDPLILAAVRASALWLREDENDLLRKEATGLTDMFLDLYTSSASDRLDFRSPVLVAFEALITLDSGREILLSNGGWATLSRDLTTIIQESSSMPNAADTARGLEVIRILLPLTEAQSGGTAEEWMNLITAVAAWDILGDAGPDDSATREFQVAVLTLSCSLLANAGAGMRGRYVHSMGAIRGVAHGLGGQVGGGDPQREALDEVLATLSELGA